MTDRLKPCPLCDGEVEWKNGHIVCKECGLSFRAFSYDLTNKKWNTRKPMDRIVQELEVEMLTEDENRKDCLWVKDWEGTRYHRARFAAFNRAIEIIKGGGKDVTTRNDTGMD